METLMDIIKTETVQYQDENRKAIIILAKLGDKIYSKYLAEMYELDEKYGDEAEKHRYVTDYMLGRESAANNIYGMILDELKTLLLDDRDTLIKNLES